MGGPLSYSQYATPHSQSFSHEDQDFNFNRRARPTSAKLYCSLGQYCSTPMLPRKRFSASAYYTSVVQHWKHDLKKLPKSPCPGIDFNALRRSLRAAAEQRPQTSGNTPAQRETSSVGVDGERVTDETQISERSVPETDTITTQSEPHAERDSITDNTEPVDA